MTPVTVYEMFPFLVGHEKLAADYSEARVTSVTLNSAKTKMEIELRLTAPIAPYEISVLERLIAGEFGLETVDIHSTIKAHVAERATAGQESSEAPSTPAVPSPKKSPPKDKRGNAAKNGEADGVIMGRTVKTTPKPMGDITIDDGTVTVRGHVCAVRSRHVGKGDAYVLNFDITDYTGTINVSRYMDEKQVQRIIGAVEKGMYLTVSGVLGDYKGEMTLRPQNIFLSDYTPRADTAPDKRVELHLHTRMSAADGLIDVKEAVERAADWGHKALAITDHGVVHAFPEAASAAKAVGGDFKIIYGMEGYLIDDTGPEGEEKKRHYHIILLAKNRTGLENLYKLVSKSHTEHLCKKRPIVFKSVLIEHREGLIAGSACERGELFCAMVTGHGDDELQEVARFYDYLEIQPLCNNMFMLVDEKNPAKSEEDLRDFNRKVVKIGESLGIPVVAACDAHFMDPENEVFRKIIQLSKGFDNAAHEQLPIYFRTTDEMLEEFAYLGEQTAFEVVVANTNKIADMCDAMSPLPPEKQFFPPKLPGSANELEDIILAGVARLYGDEIPPLVTRRIDDELKDILRLGYDVIYMAAQKLVAFLKSKGSRVGSRGSVGSSFVAYIAGITEVNSLPAHYICPECKKFELSDDTSYACGADMPDKECPRCGARYIKDGFNIPFETFLGFDGEKIPDIDLNISGEHQTISQKFVYDMFGEEYVYRAGTIGTINERKAYGMVRKYLETTGKNATRAEEARLISGCCGVKETTGQHPGGLIVIPQDKEVNDFCPIQYPANDKSKEVITTHFDYHCMEDHLIKLDMLGHDNPTMLVMLEEMTSINADDIALDDRDTMSIFTSPARLGLPDDDEIIGKTGAIGIPEFGTPFARQMLCDTQPDKFDTLVRLSGYSHGENVWIGNAQDLLAKGKIKVSETISSRDDIMLYLISVGMDAKDAFRISENVRKGKGLPAGSEKELHYLRVPQWYIDSCKKISYLFPRAHAVAYVIMAFRIAWFKVHRPLEYYSAHFYRRSRSGAFDAITMTRGIEKVKAEIRRIKTLPSITKKEEELVVSLESCYEFYLRGFDFAGIDLYESDAEKFIPIAGAGEKGLLRPPFVAINGLGTTAAKSLAENRKGHEFISIEEISAACPGVNRNNLEDLKSLGALGTLPATSQMSLF